MVKKIIVLGGGTAGWLTALFLNKNLPHCKIKVLESSKGPIGVGEGSTPPLVGLLMDLGIELGDFTKKTNATIKHAIKFENWKSINSSYYHTFTPTHLANFKDCKPIYDCNVYEYYTKYLINNNLDYTQNNYCAMLCEENKVDTINCNYSFHFDAATTGEYLREIGKQRGIENIIDDYVTADLDEQGFIKTLKTITNQTIECDFVFDATGFARLITQKLYETKWIDYREYLPVKKALTFFLEKEEKIFPYTKSIAMKNGWMWQIPLQHRIGSGYVYDSDYINEDQAKQEAENYLNKKIKFNRVIDFNPGQLDKVWVKNCIAIGLSSSFVEPLEATSIWGTVGQLYHLKHFINSLFNYDEESVRLYNEAVKKGNEEILDFIRLHYISSRDDSLFWKEFQHKNKITDTLRYKLNLLKDAKLSFLHLPNHNKTIDFDINSWLDVAYGLNIIKNKFNNTLYENFNPTISNYQSLIKQLLSAAQDHRMFIKGL